MVKYSRETSGLASLENPNALYRHFNPQSTTMSSMSSRLPSAALSADMNGNPFKDPKNLGTSTPLPSLSKFSDSSSATTLPKTTTSTRMEADSSSVSKGISGVSYLLVLQPFAYQLSDIILKSNSRSILKERAEFLKRLNLFLEENKKGRTTSAESETKQQEQLLEEPIGKNSTFNYLNIIRT
jgi:hypothetical protein